MWQIDLAEHGRPVGERQAAHKAAHQSRGVSPRGVQTGYLVLQAARAAAPFDSRSAGHPPPPAKRFNEQKPTEETVNAQCGQIRIRPCLIQYRRGVWERVESNALFGGRVPASAQVIIVRV